MLRLLIVPTVLVLATGLAACGGDDPGTPSASSSTSAPATGQDDAGAADAAGAADGAVDQVVADVTSVAPALESYYRGGPYPQTLDEAVASLVPAGVALAPGDEVGGYTYDPDAVEFVLCLQDQEGAWASYDTAPMGVRDSGGTGGCPQG